MRRKSCGWGHAISRTSSWLAFLLRPLDRDKKSEGGSGGFALAFTARMEFRIVNFEAVGRQPLRKFPSQSFRHQRQRRVDGFGVAGHKVPRAPLMSRNLVDRAKIVQYLGWIWTDLRIKLAAWAGGGLEAGEQRFTHAAIFLLI